MMLAKSIGARVESALPVAAVARFVDEHDTLIWRIVHHCVDTARAKEDHSKVNQVGVDETASRRGQNYVSIFVDNALSNLAPLEKRKVLFATPGKDSSTVAAFAKDLKAHGGDPKAVTEVSSDLSKAFAKGVAESLPNAQVTFDKFHVVSLVNDAVDQVRRLERKDHPELKGSRYDFLKNPVAPELKAHQNLTFSQGEKFDALDIVLRFQLICDSVLAQRKNEARV